MYLSINKKDIKTLEIIKLQLEKQDNQKEYTEFYNLVNKIKSTYDKNMYNHKISQIEKRKLDPTYGREYWLKQYIIDKEKAKQEGIKFTKKRADYKQAYSNK